MKNVKDKKFFVFNISETFLKQIQNKEIVKLKYLEDDVLLELSERVLERLKKMSDEEFAGIDFVAAQ